MGRSTWAAITSTAWRRYAAQYAAYEDRAAGMLADLAPS